MACFYFFCRFLTKEKLRALKNLSSTNFRVGRKNLNQHKNFSLLVEGGRNFHICTYLFVLNRKSIELKISKKFCAFSSKKINIIPVVIFDLFIAVNFNAFIAGGWQIKISSFLWLSFAQKVSSKKLQQSFTTPDYLKLIPAIPLFVMTRQEFQFQVVLFYFI